MKQSKYNYLAELVPPEKRKPEPVELCVQNVGNENIRRYAIMCFALTGKWQYDSKKFKRIEDCQEHLEREAANYNWQKALEVE